MKDDTPPERVRRKTLPTTGRPAKDLPAGLEQPLYDDDDTEPGVRRAARKYSQLAVKAQEDALDTKIKNLRAMFIAFGGALATGATLVATLLPGKPTPETRSIVRKVAALEEADSEFDQRIFRLEAAVPRLHDTITRLRLVPPRKPPPAKVEE